MHHANSIIKHKNYRALVSFIFLFTAANCLATTSLTDSLYGAQNEAYKMS